MKYGIVEAKAYNFDETGIRIGVGRTQKAIQRVDSGGPQLLPEPENQDLVPIFEAITADGAILPRMIIIAVAYQRAPWVNNELSPESLMVPSGSG